MKSMMRKLDNIKQIDLTDRQHSSNRSAAKSRSQLHSHSKSSKRRFSREFQDNFECFTDRSRTHKINEFNYLAPQSPCTVKSSSGMAKSNIKTYIRFKPFSKAEILEDTMEPEEIIEIEDDQKTVKVKVKENLSYAFDYVFRPESSQSSIYEETTKQLINKFIQGSNATVFAYGQTGSGKTYTMFGDEENTKLGVIPQAINDIFWELELMKGLNQWTLSCSMIEIYKETLIDLLAEDPKELKIKDYSLPNGQFIENLHIEEVSYKKDLLNLINKGNELRKIRGTDMNERSSRSHLIFTIYLQVKISDYETRVSKLNLVDLAGSQKVSKTKASGQGLEEAKKINLSLSCLGNTINALSKGQEHIPYRDSKLTRVLQESLSGNSLTRVIITCSLHQDCREETISSLKFGSRVKKVKTIGGMQNIQKISESGVNKHMFQSLKISFLGCEEKLQKIRTIVKNSHELPKQDLVSSINTVLFENQNVEEAKNQEGLKINLCQQNFDVGSAMKADSFVQSDELLTKISDLEQMIAKKDEVIENQLKQLKKLSQKTIKIDNPKKMANNKSVQKLKIVKVQQNNRSITHSNNNQNNKERIKTINSEKRPEQMILTPRCENQTISEFERKDTLQLSGESEKKISDFIEQYDRMKKSYEKMEKEILNHQVADLIERIAAIKKNKTGKTSQNQLKLYRQQLQCKQKYIMELEKKLITSMQFLIKRNQGEREERESLNSPLNHVTLA